MTITNRVYSIIIIICVYYWYIMVHHRIMVHLHPNASQVVRVKDITKQTEHTRPAACYISYWLVITDPNHHFPSRLSTPERVHQLAHKILHVLSLRFLLFCFFVLGSCNSLMDEGKGFQGPKGKQKKVNTLVVPRHLSTLIKQ